MSVASLMLKPNAVSRAIEEDTDRALMQDGFTLFVRIILDQAGDSGDFGVILKNAALKMYGRVFGSVGDRFEATGERLYALVEPVINAVTGDDGSWPDDTTEQIANMLELLRQAADKGKTLEIGMLREPIREIVTLVEEELGLTPEFLENVVQDFLADMSNDYEALAATLEGDEKKNAQAMALLLRRIRRRVEGEMSFSAMNPDYIATAAMKLLRKFNLDQTMESVHTTSETISEVLDVIDAVMALVPYTGQSTQSIGADHAEPEESEQRSYCWYLSWLLGDRYAHRPGSSVALHALTSLFNPSPADEIWHVDNPDPQPEETEDVEAAEETVAAVDYYIRKYLFHREQILFNSAYTTEEVGGVQETFFSFDTGMLAASEAARAGQEAAQAALTAAQAYAEQGTSAKEAFDKAHEKAKQVLENALELFQEVRDSNLKDADTAAGQSKSKIGLLQAARTTASRALQQTETDVNAALDAAGEAARTSRSQVDAAKTAVDTFSTKVDTAVDKVEEAAGSVADAYLQVQEAAAKVADAKTRAEAEPSTLTSAAQEAAQNTFEAAESAVEEAALALLFAEAAYLDASDAFDAASEAHTTANDANTAAEQANEALEAAEDAATTDSLQNLYETALEAFERAVDAVDDAADAAEDASSAALVARAAAFAAVHPPRYAFKHISMETMEDWAKGTSIGADVIEMILHAFSIERGNYLSNIILAVYSAVSFILKAALNRPIPQWIEWLTRFLGPFLGCFPHMHYNSDGASSNRTIFWFTYYGHRVLEAHAWHLTVYGFRSAILSILTLVNHNPDIDDRRPLNFKAIEGVTLLFTVPFVFLWAALTPREHYQITDKTGELIGLGWVVGGLAYSACANLLGFLTGMAIARSWNAGGDGAVLFFNQWWKTWVVSMLSYVPAMFLVHENATDDGHWGHDEVTRPYINGYPDRASSPYQLPFRDGPIQCAQGNTGIWSHTADWFDDWTSSTNQVYAYDFANDFGDEITASRDGIVVNFFDWAPDNENISFNAPAGVTLANQTNRRNWNYICLRHHNHDPAHDPTDYFFNPVHTYLIYGHGRNSSVRDTFNNQFSNIFNDPVNNPLGSVDIIGREIPQGTTIMQCDDTGVSAYNHLHTHVILAPPQRFDYVNATIDTGTATDLIYPTPATIAATVAAGGTNNITPNFVVGGAADWRVKRFSVYVLFNGIVTARDNGAGSFQGLNIDLDNSNIDYQTGAIAVAWQPGNAPPVGITISECHDTVLLVGTGGIDPGTGLPIPAFSTAIMAIAAAAPVVARVVARDTVTVQRDGVDMVHDDGNGGFESVLNSDGDNCSIDYGTRAINAAWIDGFAPAGRVAVTAQYETNEKVGEGDGTQTPDLLLPHAPVAADTIVVFLDDQPLVEDDGAGNVRPVIDTTPAASQVTYSPGNIDVTWLADHAPANTVAITAHFETTHLVGTGNDAQLIFPAVLPAPMEAGSVSILLDGTQIAVEDGAGGFVGDTIETGPGQSQVNHATGQVDIVFQAGQAPATGIDVQAVYRGQQAVGIGNGAQLAFNSPLHGDVSAGSLTIHLDGTPVVADDGAGNMNAIVDTTAGVSGVDYATGELTLVWRSGHVSPDGIDINVRYEAILSLGEGDNTTLRFDGVIPTANFTPGTVKIQLNTIEAAKDDTGTNKFSNFVDTAPGSTTIDYIAGNLDVAWLAGHEPAVGAEITTDYDFGEHIGTAAAGTVGFNTTLPVTPARPGGIRVLVDLDEHAVDDANGSFAGTNASAGNIDAANSSINYATGAMTITWVAGTEPAAGEVVVVYEPTNVLDDDDFSNWTLPFVYRNARHAELYHLGDGNDDGVPKSLRYYTAE